MHAWSLEHSCFEEFVNSNFKDIKLGLTAACNMILVPVLIQDHFTLYSFGLDKNARDIIILDSLAFYGVNGSFYRDLCHNDVKYLIAYRMTHLIRTICPALGLKWSGKDCRYVEVPTRVSKDRRGFHILKLMEVWNGKELLSNIQEDIEDYHINL